MISLRKSLDDHERTEIDLLLLKTRECYIRAIEIFQKHAVELSSDEAKGHRSNLGQLKRRISGETSVQGLEDTSRLLETEVQKYNAGVSKAFRSGKDEVRQIISLLHEATGALANGDARHETALRDLATNLEITSQAEDLREIRINLARQVGELRVHISKANTERVQTLHSLHLEIESIEQRLHEAERLASTDPLTNLFNRREGEKRASAKLQNGHTFCLLILDLNRFKWINDRFGHLAGDQVLEAVARKLELQVRSDDVVCRWGGDEFLIVMDCKLSDALPRSRLLARAIQGRYQVTSNGRKVDVEISASIGVSQCEPGDDLDVAFERADGMLYQVKTGPEPR